MYRKAVAKVGMFFSVFVIGGGFPNKPMGFPTKNDHFGVFPKIGNFPPK